MKRTDDEYRKLMDEVEMLVEKEKNWFLSTQEDCFFS